MNEQLRIDDSVWSRIGVLEKQDAAMERDIRGILGGLEEIRDVLVRMQENARPNLGGMFLILLATCTFFVSIGGLALAPIYREQGRTSTALVEILNTQNDMRANRFTSFDGQELDQQITERMHENERLFNETRARVAKIEGILSVTLQNEAKE